VLYVANKADNPRSQGEALEHYELGMDSLMPVSALHGHGVGDLEEALVALFPEAPPEPSEEEEAIDRVAIVGRPNAGKSSLVNRIIGEKRQIVDDRPGTTVDSIDTLIELDGAPLILIDTAGIRRKRSVERGLESLAVMQAIRAVERSNVVVLMIDAHEGASEQDAKIAGLAIERGRALVIALNKGDLLDDAGRKAALTSARDVFNFAAWAPIQLVSVENGRGVRKLMQLVRTVSKAHKHRVTTAAVNRFFEEVLAHHPPPTMNNRSVRLYYATQVQASPPTFVIASNYPERVHFSYRRYVVNQLRERFGFDGTPVRVFYRGKEARS
jgi:GTP-binding protein